MISLFSDGKLGITASSPVLQQILSVQEVGQISYSHRKIDWQGDLKSHLVYLLPQDMISSSCVIPENVCLACT